MTTAFQFVSRLLYIVVTLALMALAFGFVAYAGWSVYRGLTDQESLLHEMLRAVGLVIIALAVSDVGKFLLEEELNSDRELETTGEVRRTLTKFITIIIIAASLESLVFIFEGGRDRLELLLYPSLLLIAVAVLIGVLGLYQRLAAAVEHVHREDLGQSQKLDPEKAALEREDHKER